MKATDGPCVICGHYLRVNTGRNSEGRVIYARFEGVNVPVGSACESHFTQAGRDPKRWGPWDVKKTIILAGPRKAGA
jgi:hypothetical protein